VNLKGTRVRVGGGGNLVRHVSSTADNEVVEVIEGDLDMVDRAERTAARYGRKYGVRHIAISPDQELSRDELAQMVDNIVSEFAGGTLDGRELAIVAHRKARADGSSVMHYHVMISETALDGSVLDSSHMYARHEKLSRVAEVAFGHALTQGRHNRAVAHALMEEGNVAVAEAIRPLTEGPPAVANFSSKALAKSKRLGVDLPGISRQLAAVADAPLEQRAAVMADLERDHPGLSFEKGDRRPVVLMRFEGEDISNANKALGIKAAQVDAILEMKGTADAGLRRTDAPGVQLGRLPGAGTRARPRTGRTTRFGS
jgi:hypothetical protein